jgi:hypothetical protein
MLSVGTTGLERKTRPNCFVAQRAGKPQASDGPELREAELATERRKRTAKNHTEEQERRRFVA